MGLLNKILPKRKGTADDLLNAAINSGLEVSFSVPNHVKVSSTVYLQELLSQIVGNSIRLRIVSIKKAKKPKGWDNIRGDAALVNNVNVLYGVMFEDSLSRSGHSIGDEVDCLVTKTSKGTVELWLPLTGKKIVEKEEIDESHFGINVTKKGMVLSFSGDEIELVECSVKALPVKAGSKAKPVLQVLTADGEIVCEISARSVGYKDLEPWEGKTAKKVKVFRKYSEYEDCDIYYRVWFMFL